MGMYTALHLAIELPPETPNEVLDILQYMTDDSDEYSEPKELPDHPLFQPARRWGGMLRGDSYYHVAQQVAIFKKDPNGGQYYLTVLSSFKNYHDEISLFLDWIKDYVRRWDDEDGPRWVGYSWYEEDVEPSWLYA